MQFRTLRNDLLAGLTGAVAGAPQAMGFAIVAGVSPLYGLYTAFVTTIIGGIFTHSVFMTIGPTNALSLVLASAILGVDDAAGIERMIVLSLLTGVFLLLIGVLKLGRLTRFVSSAVMTGFISGAGLLIILGQLDHLTGYEGESGSMPLLRFVDWVLHLHESDPQTVVVGLLAMGIIWGLHHTRFKSVATLVAIIVTSLLVVVLGWTNVDLVRDMSQIPAGLPALRLPDLSLIPSMAPIAMAIAVLGAVQSAALSQSIPNPDGTEANVSRDFAAMGLANIVGGLLQNMPACGSLSRTAVNMSAGAQTRLANISAGVFVGLTILFAGGVIEQITLATLAGHLVVAAASLFRFDQIRLIWRVNQSSRLSMAMTFLSTLVLPLEYSIYIGVVLSLMLYVYSSAKNIVIERIVPIEDNRYRADAVPQRLQDGDVVVLSVHGHLYFAAVKQLEDTLPDPKGSRNAVVILRLRENNYLGATGIQMLEKYAQRLRDHNGHLILVGIAPRVRRELEKTEAINFFGAENVFDADPVFFQATERAIERANLLRGQADAQAPA